jgi:O-antigen ligase
LAISPTFSFDPINPIKVLVLVAVASLGLGLILPYFQNAIFRAGKTLPLILAFFMFGMLSTLFLSGANKSQQFWGVFGRNTGFLTYLALVVTIFLTAILRERETYKKLSYGLVLTTIIMIGYCLLQVAGLDPVNWSAFFPFGTLGNVNFLSGYLGLALVIVLVLVFSDVFNSISRILLALVLGLGIFVLIKSDSTQGFVALVIGASTFVLLKLWMKSKIIFSACLLIYVAGLISLVMALLNRGPLREFIYQFTIVYRADYMHAGWKMMITNPLTGVGMDSYDDWYRADRGVISAYRTGFNRTANSAHNIMLDLGASGGLPLFIAYLALNLFILIMIIKGLKFGLQKDPIFLGISMSWFAYQVQASVSINQVGVGVWGWILGGAVIGYVKSYDSDTGVELNVVATKKNSKKANKAKIAKQSTNLLPPPPIAVLTSFALFSIGFSLAFLPLRADASYMDASRKGAAESLLEYSRNPAVNAFLLSRSLEISHNSGLQSVSDELLGTLLSKFPRNLYGQLLTIERPNSSAAEREAAKAKVIEIDPYLALCFDSNPVARHLQELSKLQPETAYDLAKGWGLVSADSSLNPKVFRWNSLDSMDLQSRLTIFCSP